MHPWLLPSPHPSVLAMSTLPSPAFSRLMVQAACPGTAGSRGDAGGSSVVRGRAGCWPSSSKTCACRVKRAAGLPASLCHPTGCAPPAPRPQVTHTVKDGPTSPPSIVKRNSAGCLRVCPLHVGACVLGGLQQGPSVSRLNAKCWGFSSCYTKGKPRRREERRGIWQRSKKSGLLCNAAFASLQGKKK